MAFRSPDFRRWQPACLQVLPLLTGASIRKHNQLGAYRAFGNLDVGRVAALGEPSSVVRYAAHEWDAHQAEALQAIREIAAGMELEIQ
jgi:hypothetical protein